MHLYSRAVGLESIKTRSDMDNLINDIVVNAINNKSIIFNRELAPSDGFYSAQIDESLYEVGGLTIIGIYNPDKEEFITEFYYPYAISDCPRFNNELSVERKADKEAYLVHCNEPKRDVTPIFFLRNIQEYLRNSKINDILENKFVYLSALSAEGKIIFPVLKTDEQIEKCKASTKERNQLVDKALQGDQSAIDSLTIGDYDTLNDICHRVVNEDVYSIVDSSFIPSGLECDLYSVVGNINQVKKYENKITKENIYYMSLECNDIEFNLSINANDVYGIPTVNSRFVGKVWLQGAIYYGDDEFVD